MDSLPPLPGDGRFPDDPEFEGVEAIAPDGVAAVRYMARVQGEYFTALLAEGMEREEALELTCRWMEVLGRKEAEGE